jgi:hypothetical protein
MGGCFKSIGCLVVLIAVAAGAWFGRDYWTPYLHRVTAPAAAAPVHQAGTWQPATPEGAVRARTIIERLASRNGPVYANVEPGDLTAFIIQQLSHQLPPSARDVAAMVSGDQLLVRCTVNPNDLGDLSQLGPLAQMLGDQEQVQFGGTLDVIKPGLGEYRVQSFRIHDFAIPHAMIPRLIKSYSKGARPPGVADDGLPLITPVHIGDVRIRSGQITLYKAVR